MDKFFYKKKLIGIRIKNFSDGFVPITDEVEPLQVLAFKHQKGYIVKPHKHLPKKRITKTLQEFLFVKKGRIRIDLFAPNKRIFKRVYLNSGEAFILRQGGCGAHILKDAEIFEIKNGPFIDDKVLIF